MMATRRRPIDGICRRTHADGGRERAGYTLLELVVSLGAATILCAGMASAVSLAGRSMEASDSPQALSFEAVDAQRQMARDLQHALRFTERTPNAITLIVPDRDGNGRPESVRYAWSGTPGDPLTWSLNGGTPVDIRTGVQSFAFDFETRTMTAPPLVINPSPAGGGGSGGTEGEPVAAIEEPAAEQTTVTDSGGGSLETFLTAADTGGTTDTGNGKKK